jgi:hypothetical protein
VQIVGIQDGDGAVQVAALSGDGTAVAVLAPPADFWADGSGAPVRPGCRPLAIGYEDVTGATDAGRALARALTGPVHVPAQHPARPARRASTAPYDALEYDALEYDALEQEIR